MSSSQVKKMIKIEFLDGKPDLTVEAETMKEAVLKARELNISLPKADLSYANLYGANLSGANLWRANLYGADLYGADLYGANLDFSCWPLWCGSLSVKIDKRIFVQLLYHTLRAGQSVEDDEVKALLNNESVVNLANQFHRVEECGKIEVNK